MIEQHQPPLSASGCTFIEDQCFKWSERDVFVVPGWHWA
jgi:gentisate 1,2-dioxygenase